MRKTYTDSELNEIIELVQKGKSKAEALKEIFESEEVNNLAERVKGYFKLDSLIPKSRKTEELAPAVVFYYLICDLTFMPRSVKNHYTAVKHTDHDRSSYLHYVSQFEADQHKADNRYVKGDSLYNHFLKIKGEINEKDYSELRIDPFIPHNLQVRLEAKDTFKEILSNNLSEIEVLVNQGTSAKYLNDNYFNFSSPQMLRIRLGKERPDLLNKLRSSFHSKVRTCLEENRLSVNECVKKGYNFKKINDLYFGYTQVSDFKRVLLKYEPELYHQIKEND